MFILALCALRMGPPGTRGGKWANEWETNKRMLKVCLTLR